MSGAEEGVYIASKAKHGARWQTLRTDTEDLSDLWSRNVAEASGAKALIIYVEPGEVLKGALVEVGAALGAALGAGVPVYWVGPYEGQALADAVGSQS